MFSDISSKPPFFNIDSDLDQADLPIGETTGEQDTMFHKATSFNQDLTGRDVSNISSKPPFFNIDSDLDEDDLPVEATTESN